MTLFKLPKEKEKDHFSAKTVAELLSKAEMLGVDVTLMDENGQVWKLKRLLRNNKYDR